MVDLKKGTMIDDPKIIGIMTTRPIHIVINNSDKDAKFDAYYVVIIWSLVFCSCSEIHFKSIRCFIKSSSGNMYVTTTSSCICSTAILLKDVRFR